MVFLYFSQFTIKEAILRLLYNKPNEAVNNENKKNMSDDLVKKSLPSNYTRTLIRQFARSYCAELTVKEIPVSYTLN